MIYSIPIYSPGAWFISGTRLVLSIAMPGCYRMAVELAFSCDWVYGRYFTNYSSIHGGYFMVYKPTNITGGPSLEAMDCRFHTGYGWIWGM